MVTITLVASQPAGRRFRVPGRRQDHQHPARQRRSDVRQRLTQRRGLRRQAALRCYSQPQRGAAAGDHRRHGQLPRRRRPEADRRGGGGDRRPTTIPTIIQTRTAPAVNVQPLISPELRAAVAAGKVASQIRTGPTRRRPTKYLVYGSPVPTRFGQVELYYLVPLTRQDADRGRCPSHRAGHRRRPGDPARPARGAGHPAGGQPGPGRRAHRPAALGRPARPADGGQRRGRPGPARRLVQPDGDQPAAADRPAGGDVPAAAPVHLRRLARAAHPADHRPDGRRPDLRRARRVRPGGGPQRRAAAGRARPVRGACSPTCWRSAGSTPASPCWTPSRPTWCRWCTGWSTGWPALAERVGVPIELRPAGRRR